MLVGVGVGVFVDVGVGELGGVITQFKQSPKLEKPKGPASKSIWLIPMISLFTPI